MKEPHFNLLNIYINYETLHTYRNTMGDINDVTIRQHLNCHYPMVRPETCSQTCNLRFNSHIEENAYLVKSSQSELRI